MDTASSAWRLRDRAATLAIVSKPSPETIAIIAVGATLLIAVCGVGVGLGMLWSNGQARTDATVTEGQARTDAAIAELRRDMQDVRERLARLETIILARHEPGSRASDG